MPTSSRKMDFMLSARGSVMMSANDQILAVKLGYEWKNIYRLLAQRNNQSETQDHLIEVDEFDKIC